MKQLLELLAKKTLEQFDRLVPSSATSRVSRGKLQAASTSLKSMAKLEMTPCVGVPGFFESVSVVCRGSTWPFDFGLETMAVASTSPTMLIGLETAGRVALRAELPLRHS